MLNVLQIGRAIAALVVCAFHMSLVFQDGRFGGKPVFDAFTSQGYLGVDFFFALSGFIIFFAHDKDIGHLDKLPHYAIKRFIRIYPVYWVVTLAVLVGAVFSGGVNQPPSSLRDTLTLVSLVRFSDFDTPVHAAWTLFHEVFFYALFAVMIWRRNLGIFLFMAWLLFVCAGASIGLDINSNAYVKLVSEPVNIQFFAGMASFYIYDKLKKQEAVWFFIIGVALLGLWLANDWENGSQILSKTCLAVCFTFILSGTVAIENNGAALNVPFLKLIGDASFSLYLIHESIQSLGLKLVSKYLPGLMLHPVLVYFLVLSLCVLTAVFMYSYVERPILRRMRQILLPSRAAHPERRHSLAP